MLMQLWFGQEKPVAYNSQSDAVDQGLFVWEMGYRLYGLFEAMFWCSSQVLRELIQQKQKFEHHKNQPGSSLKQPI